MLRRIGRSLALGFLLFASLLAFPGAIPWMIAVWLAWHTVLIARGRPGWPPLAICAAVVSIKRVPWPAGLIVLGVVVLLAGLLQVHGIRERIGLGGRWLVWSGAVALWIAWAVMAVEWHAAAHCSRRAELERTRPVVCLGDSLTSGLPPYGGYPECLRRMVSVPVVNMGEPGMTTRRALHKLPALIAANPQVVVVELGGNDYLGGSSRASIRANLEKILAAAREIEAEVILMEVPRGFITDPFAGLERKMARRHDLELVSDTAMRKLMLWSPHAPPGTWTGGPHLSDDGLHPNALGNRLLAEYVAAALLRLYGPAIRSAAAR